VGPKRTILSGCGGSSSSFDPAKLPKVTSDLTVSAEEISGFMKELLQSEIHRVTGGVHAVGLCSGGRILARSFDIGRHNALDRLCGQALTAQMIRGLCSIEGVTVYGPGATPGRIGVVSFTVEGMHPHDVAHHLDEEADIMVRSGHHCCMPLMDHLGTPDGTVRASLHCYNTVEDVETLIDTVRMIAGSV
jgi:selenocysteine lyase/cysteine desulfurase